MNRPDPEAAAHGRPPSDWIAALRADRALSVVRAERIPDAADLCQALVEGGIRTVELTFTTPDVLVHLARAADSAARTGAVVGVGTVLTAEQAKQAVDAGAAFLVTPGIRAGVAELAVSQGIPVFCGALTPTEVATAVDLGSTAVKIFPAGQFGPKYLRDLQGPYPGVSLLPSGGITAANAAAYLQAGAMAVCAGTGVVPPEAVAIGNWSEITSRARDFVTALEA
jgi:2-dehydro-3-deoxyphosphogluconate aldolase/(4S)-4-hydroxy-2-oxoglutarate aldolase